jgi:hypothetical protein
MLVPFEKLGQCKAPESIFGIDLILRSNYDSGTRFDLEIPRPPDHHEKQDDL